MLTTSLNAMKGIGEKKYSRLVSMGLKTYADVLCQYPFRYIDRRKIMSLTDIQDGQEAVIEAQVIRKHLKKWKKDILLLQVRSHFHTGEVLFFSPKYLEKDFKEGDSYFFYGKVEKKGNVFKVIQPEYAKHTDISFLKIVPIYSLVSGISQKEMQYLHYRVLNDCLPYIEESLPSEIVAMKGLCDKKTALKEIHFPKDEDTYKQAKERLVFEELFELQMKLLMIKKHHHKGTGIALGDMSIMEPFVKRLPYQLTGAQQKVIDDIVDDFKSGFAMNRLVQGDVGSGKTILAFAAIAIAVSNGKQAAMLAPTALLAEQHYESFVATFGDQYRCALLVSKLKPSDKEGLKRALLSGELDVVIGTHAILQDDVAFKDLALVVADEQHRFGIRQRLAALHKGNVPHCLLMSATPIPRTLSLILYGDMDVSILDDMPLGRKAIKTHFVKTSKEDDMYRFVENQLAQGRQAYFVCPLVEESEALDLTSASEHYTVLKETYKAYGVGLVHGKMKPKEKEDVMRQFKNRDIHVLVSTTVIEVGINVPNATIMVILHAERFGLSQLHQMRGRVGRGAEQSYCFLHSDKLGRIAKERIETLVKTTSGFDIAEKDLSLRGPGEIFGTRQHGLPELKIASLIHDKKVLIDIQKYAKIVFTEYQMGNQEMVRYFKYLEKTLMKDFTL